MSDRDETTETTPPTPAWRAFQLPGSPSGAVEVRGFGLSTEVVLRLWNEGSAGDPTPDRLLRLGKALLTPAPVDDRLRAALAGRDSIRRYAAMKSEVAECQRRLGLLDSKLKETEARREGLVIEGPPGVGPLLVKVDGQLAQLRADRAATAKELDAWQSPLKTAKGRAVSEAEKEADALTSKRAPVFHRIKALRAEALRGAVQAVAPYLDRLAGLALAEPFAAYDEHEGPAVGRIVEQLAAQVDLTATPTTAPTST